MFRVVLISILGDNRAENEYNFGTELEAHSFALWAFFNIRNAVAAEIHACCV